MTTETVSFETTSFTWADGTFVLEGTWSEDADGLGRVRLLVDVDGRRRNVGAQGGKTAGGSEWRAKFICRHPPDPDGTAALKVGDEEIPLPAPEHRAPAPEPEQHGLLEQLQRERAAADAARQKLARERRAAEEVEARLLATRRRIGEPVARPSQKLEPLAYAVAAAIALMFLIFLSWLL